MNVPATHLASRYRGVFIDTMSNEDMSVQNRDRNRSAGEGSSQEFYIAKDNDGHDINLNFPLENF